MEHKVEDLSSDNCNQNFNISVEKALANSIQLNETVQRITCKIEMVAQNMEEMNETIIEKASDNVSK